MKLRDFMKVNQEPFVRVTVKEDGQQMKFETVLVDNKANMHLNSYTANKITSIKTLFDSKKDKHVLCITVAADKKEDTPCKNTTTK